jgi:LysM repeat protein
MTDRSRSPLRFLAPAALVAFGLALFFIVSSSSVTSPERPTPAASGSTEKGGSTKAAKESRRSRRERRREGRLPRNVYTVQPGDTLDGIAQKTGRSTEQLQKLNPDLDPQALGPGQKIKLRE